MEKINSTRGLDDKKVIQMDNYTKELLERIELTMKLLKQHLERQKMVR